MKLLRRLYQKKSLFLLLLLFLFWLILSPRISLQAMIIGLIISIILVLYNQDLLFEEKETSFYSSRGFIGLFKFIGILIVEIIKANLDVAKIVLSPSMPVSPCFVRVPLRHKKDLNKVLYANSITLTPGTLSVDIKKGEILVHALTKGAAEAMEKNPLEKYTLKLEEK